MTIKLTCTETFFRETARGRLRCTGWSKPERALKGLHVDTRAGLLAIRVNQLKSRRVLGGSHFLGIALLAEFTQEIFLADGTRAIQQVEQQIFWFRGASLLLE